MRNNIWKITSLGNNTDDFHIYNGGQKKPAPQKACIAWFHLSKIQKQVKVAGALEVRTLVTLLVGEGCPWGFGILCWLHESVQLVKMYWIMHFPVCILYSNKCISLKCWVFLFHPLPDLVPRAKSTKKWPHPAFSSLVGSGTWPLPSPPTETYLDSAPIFLLAEAITDPACGTNPFSLCYLPSQWEILHWWFWPANN